MSLRACEPNLREGPGGWLANTPPDYPYRIGVVGEDRDDARERFTAALAPWSELHDRQVDEGPAED
jgi:hypothetical protein